MARRCDGKRCGSGSSGIRRTDGGGRVNRRAAESRVSGGRWRRLLSSLRQEQLQAVAGSSGHGGGGGGGSSLQTPGSGSLTAPHTPGTWEPGNRFRPSGSPPPSAARHGRPPPLASAQRLLRKCPRCAPSPKPCQRLQGRLLLTAFLPLSLGPGGSDGGGTSPHSAGSGAALCEARRLRSRLALPHSPSPFLLVLRLLPPPPSLTPPSAPPPA